MAERWSVAQVEGLGDASSVGAAQTLALPAKWSQTGYAEDAPATVWGMCRGSGAKPYQTCVALTEPAYLCSCPSRGFPCKHTLGLLLLWAAGSVPDESDRPDWVRQWHAGRTARTARTRRVAPDAPRSATQEKAAQRRADRVAAGMAELDQWLTDQVRGGIAGLDRAGYRHFDQMAARLVDAQAATLASDVRRLAGVAASGDGWPERMLAELGMLRMLVHAYRRRDDLPDPLTATVRTRIGFTVPTDQVLATPGVRDDWQVIAVRTDADERLVTRRSWLLGSDTCRPALVLSFAPAGQTLAADLVVGTVLDARLCFYPGSLPLRALVSQKEDTPRPQAVPAPALDVRAALAAHADALAADPWLKVWPMLLQGAIMPGRPWRFVDETGAALPLYAPAGEPWRLLAATGGHPSIMAGEWGPAGLRALTVFVDGAVTSA